MKTQTVNANYVRNALYNGLENKININNNNSLNCIIVILLICSLTLSMNSSWLKHCSWALTIQRCSWTLTVQHCSWKLTLQHCAWTLTLQHCSWTLTLQHCLWTLTIQYLNSYEQHLIEKYTEQSSTIKYVLSSNSSGIGLQHWNFEYRKKHGNKISFKGYTGEKIGNENR